MLLPVLLSVPIAFAIAWPLTAWLVRAGTHLGTLDTAGAAGHEKRVLRAVPNIGGVAIYAAVAIPLLAGVIALATVPATIWERWLPGIVPHLDRLDETLPTAIALLVGMTTLHIMGLADDRRPLSPWFKLAIQITVATGLVIGFDVRLLTLLGPVPSILITIGWIVVITNAINFLDNMDGLAGGVSAIAALLLMIATIVNTQWFIAGTLGLLAGALAGFLVFNYPPARIFMGDGGSLVVGFLLAVLTARTTFYNPADGDLGSAWYGVFMPLVVLAVPLYDFTTVTLLRLRQGRSPFVGDQQHLSHRLVRRRMSQRGAVVVIWGLTAVTGIGGISLGSLAWWQAILVGAQTLLVLMVVAMYEHASRHAVGDAADETPHEAEREVVVEEDHA
ncbi:MAG: undecaprenyl/decaprenyl-phosphate alpha-N-acetylglucosaminyl 1-phosphate transferase [Phycisphaerales bacterium]|nr:undecaprenyl/decaprenyl-phosphate alpha-N-acetylglucosaminyl 1-phosphate transferase [Phycisphaerales bacterium]